MLAKRKMNCSDAKKVDVIDFLASVGYKPKKINSKEAWYNSPLRPDEKKPSFRVNINRQLWYDYGIGEGGDIIKLGCKLFNCSIKELLEKLQNQCFSFSQPIVSITDENKIIVDSIAEISDPSLLNYIKKRAIDFSIAKTYCKQVNYRVGKYQFNSVGFINDSDGWELRSEKFKGATKKGISTISNNSDSVCVFEGFFDTLSFIQLHKETYHKYNFITLNSLSLLDKVIVLVKSYNEVNLYLDNDSAGELASQKLMELDARLIKNCSNQFYGSKDLNELLMKTTHNSKSNI
ncbi:MAG: toprim domain-containing protein [Bacteroidales bacterium]|nr:toprim domain-containing protein [Bacteroidales bacterium]